MNIIRIDSSNLAEHLDDLLALSNEFLELICGQGPRPAEDGRRVLESMIANAPTTVLLKAEGEEGTPMMLKTEAINRLVGLLPHPKHDVGQETVRSATRCA